mmetsp:Transcript_39359/g.59157  ORF Transcript_39359/g.59157 Transcript_39359/m.59157 type:complete len:219 (+) Transcript_39359:602-1258(+)
MGLKAATKTKRLLNNQKRTKGNQREKRPNDLKRKKSDPDTTTKMKRQNSQGVSACSIFPLPLLLTVHLSAKQRTASKTTMKAPLLPPMTNQPTLPLTITRKHRPCLSQNQHPKDANGAMQSSQHRTTPNSGPSSITPVPKITSKKWASPPKRIGSKLVPSANGAKAIQLPLLWIAKCVNPSVLRPVLLTTRRFVVSVLLMLTIRRRSYLILWSSLIGL